MLIKSRKSFFDTIASIFPKPDAILSVGDMINDNGFDKPKDHKIVKEIFLDNLKRKKYDRYKSNTVMDGQQASNPNLNIDLKDYPQVITLT